MPNPAPEPSAPPASTIIFVNRFFHPDLSATSQLMSDLAFDLASTRRVLVITSALRYDDPAARLPAREAIRGVTVRRVATTGFGRGGLAGKAIDLASFHLAAGMALVRYARRGDIIVAKTDPPLLSVIAGVAARFKGARLVNWLQDVYPEVATALGVGGLSGFVSHPLRLLRDASLRRARANVVLGETMAAHVRKLGVPSDQIRIVPNWTDERAVAPLPPDQNPLRHAWGLEEKFVVAYSGNLGRAHEYATVVGAAELLRDEPSIRFLMIGDGHHTRALREEVQARRLTNFTFQPYQPPELLAQSLGAGDAHWVSLRPELEGLIVPSKVYGVLAAGRPIIAVTSADGEVARLVSTYGCGLHVEPGDAEAFARAVRQLAADPGFAARLGGAARAAAVGAFARETSLAKWGRLLEDLDQADGGAVRRG